MKTKLAQLSFGLIIIAGLVLYISSCSKDESPKPEPVATSIQLVSGNSQTSDIETALANPVEVIVKDQDGNVFKGAKVNFSVTEGSVSLSSATTDANGKAQVTWTLGSTVGTQGLTITGFKADGKTALSGSPITVNAIATKKVATSIELVSGGDQTAEAETNLANPVIVKVKDQNGIAFPGATVNFAVTEGSVSSATAISDASGNVSVSWTLGPTAGTQTLTVTAVKADGTTPLTGSPLAINAIAAEVAVATSIELVSGGDQTAEAETNLANPVIVKVKDQNGIAFPGATVNFAVTEGSVSSATAISDASGNVSVSWTLGSTAGTQTLTVTAFKVDGTTALTGSPLTVNATANVSREATSIGLSLGGDQFAAPGSTLPQQIIVKVNDQNDLGLSGVSVYFEVTEGSVSPSSTITDAGGFARVTWTLGSTPGTQTLTVTAFKADGTTNLTGSPLLVYATASSASSIELSSGGDQTGIVGISLVEPIEVLVKDSNGNDFKGATVNFEVSEGSVSSASAISDADGKASVTWTLGSTEGVQTLTVTSFKLDGTTPLTGSPLSVTATATAISASNPVTDFDGNEYQTVNIGNQIWMTENLKVTHYPDGTVIPLITNNTTWKNLADNDLADAYCYYNNNASSVYGALYTSAAAMKGSGSSNLNPSGVQGVCPDGWHLPSSSEWNELIDILGGPLVAGGKLKSVSVWKSPNTGATNESTFTALPGGYRRGDNGISAASSYTGTWHSTYHLNNTNVLIYTIGYSSAHAGSSSMVKSGGYSVRCVKD